MKKKTISFFIMLKAVNPKLPMRNKGTTRNFYITKLGFKEFGSADFDGYLMLEKDEIQIHFFDLITKIKVQTPSPVHSSIV